jgi:hypothetical protein
VSGRARRATARARANARVLREAAHCANRVIVQLSGAKLVEDLREDEEVEDERRQVELNVLL